MNVEASSRVITCIVSGDVLAWKGYGRPPKYSPAVRAEIERKRRADRYTAKREALGKTVKRRGSV